MTENVQSNAPISLSAQIESDADKISRKKTANSKQAINQLPSELLSRIFAVGDGEQRSKRLQNCRYNGFQDLAVVSP